MEDFQWERPITKTIPVFVGWPDHQETLTVMSRSQQVANAPDTVVTRCFNSFGDEILVFHRDEELLRADVVNIDSDGNLIIKRSPRLTMSSNK